MHNNSGMDRPDEKRRGVGKKEYDATAVDAYVAGYADYIKRSPTSYHAAQNAAEFLEGLGFARQDERELWSAEPGGHYVLRDGAVAAWVVPKSVGPKRLVPKPVGAAPTGTGHEAGNSAAAAEASDGGAGGSRSAAVPDNRLMAGAITGDPGRQASFRIVGAHTDSPALKLKPTPQSTTRDGWGQLAVEVYGGMLLNSWLDRELLLAGRVVDRAGQTHLVCTGPIARVPQLAIHLDRQFNKGLELNPQQHMHPVWTVDNPDVQVMDLVAEAVGPGVPGGAGSSERPGLAGACEGAGALEGSGLAGASAGEQTEGTEPGGETSLAGPGDIAGFDLFLCPAQEPARFGAKKEFFASWRQDNLSSVYAGLVALKAVLADGVPDSGDVLVFIANDHEEVGSATRSGAAGPLLEDVLRRTAWALGLGGDEVARMLAGSVCVSSDAGHSVHPNYADRHDPETRPVMGRGPMVKINANQRYASDAVGIARWRRACEDAGVVAQDFVSNNAMPCGSTIGPITATRLGMTTVDVGIPLLSMHSAREMSHVDDCYALSLALEAFWR